LAAAAEQLITIKPELCVDFLEAWQYDLETWEATCLKTNNVGSVHEAMSRFDGLTWQLAQFGEPCVDGNAARAPLSLATA
jgi:hypothetical protein